jgi:hypothetical protein
MKIQLLSTLQTLKSVRSRSKAMKNDSFLSNEMDLPEENAFCNGSDDGGNEFTNGSSYNQDEALEAKQSGNVNSSPSQWPLRHNNHNESLERQNSYSCNGIRQAKEPRYTCAGRISRIPSRYLDTDSDSGDGSARKDGQNRLKIKQRSRRKRKLPSSTSKLLVNGFKEHEDALLFSVTGFEVDRNTDNLSEGECLANVEYPDVFEDTSPISNDKISHVAHETQYKNKSHPDTSLSNEIMCSETSQGDAVKGETIIVDNFLSMSKQTAEHSLTSSGCCVDISSKDNSRARFESLMESSEETATETHHVNEKTVENCSTRLVNTSCKRKNLHEASKGDSSTRQTFVSPKPISKDGQVSCAIHNDSTGSFLEKENCKSCKECSVNSTCILTENTQNIESSEFESSGKITGDIGSKLSKKKRLVKTTKRPRKKLALKDELNDSEANTLPSQAEGLERLKDSKMRKAFAKKLKQNHPRRNEKTDKNDVLKRNRKNGVICKVKQKAFGKANGRKMAKQTDKTNRKVNKVTSKVKDTEVTKPSEHSEELDRVLGMRRSPNGIYEFLVEWRNGTSCWVSSDDIVMDKHNYYLREYLVESEQDVSVVNRVPFQAYCCDSLSLKECKPALKSKKALTRMLCVEETVPKPVCKLPVVSTKQKDNVSVEYEDDYCYITLNRETCKRKNTSLKIMADLIKAFEDAATSECETVVLRGLQSDVLCGLKLDDMSKTGAEKENGILSQARYYIALLSV